MSRCRICAGEVSAVLDLGRMPLADAFRRPDDDTEEFFFPLVVGRCEGCTMVQLLHEAPREAMFHQDYPYYSSGSSVMREHFSHLALELVDRELAGRTDPFVVELGCNDGVMLATLAEQGIRHLGVEPSGGVGEVAAAKGVRVRTDFFEAEVAAEIRAVDGPADVIYAANTFCHIPYMDSVFTGIDTLLADDGTFVFEDLRRGTVDVELRVIGSKTPILTLRDVDLRAPGAATDRRLEQVDVRGLVPDAPPPPRANGTR